MRPRRAAPPASNPDLLPVGCAAPAFTLKTPAGETVSLADFRGKAVLLEIFAVWCPHCAAEAPHLRDLAESMAAENVAFVSIDGSGADAASVFAYHVYFGLPFPALLDPDPNSEPARVPRPRHAGAGLEGLPPRLLPDLLRDRPEGPDRLALRRRAAGRAAAAGARARRRGVARCRPDPAPL